MNIFAGLLVLVVAAGLRVEREVALDVPKAQQTPSTSNDGFGHSLLLVGDVDNDKVRDLLIGASHQSGPGPDRFGAVYALSLGKLTPVYCIPGVARSPCARLSLASIGDTDGDGICEAVVGAPDELQRRGGGEISAFSGKNGTRLWTILPGADERGFGSCICISGSAIYAIHLCDRAPVIKKITFKGEVLETLRVDVAPIDEVRGAVIVEAQDKLHPAQFAIALARPPEMHQVVREQEIVLCDIATGRICSRRKLDSPLLELGRSVVSVESGNKEHEQLVVIAASPVHSAPRQDGVLLCITPKAGVELEIDEGQFYKDNYPRRANDLYSEHATIEPARRLGAYMVAGFDWNSDGRPDLLACAPGDFRGDVWVLDTKTWKPLYRHSEHAEISESMPIVAPAVCAAVLPDLDADGVPEIALGCVGREEKAPPGQVLVVFSASQRKALCLTSGGWSKTK